MEALKSGAAAAAGNSVSTQERFDPLDHTVETGTVAVTCGIRH
jgi:hypothetical protein